MTSNSFELLSSEFSLASKYERKSTTTPPFIPIKKCLITGGCGFIGRHFTKKMECLGYSCTVVDNISSKSALLPEQWPTHLKCDNINFLNINILEYLLTIHDTFDIIIHASAIVGGRETIENDPLLISQNITIDNELFRWIEKNPVKYLVYFSSSAVYPTSLQTSENYRKLKLEDIDIYNDKISIPDLTYGWSKLTGEFLLSILSKRVDTKISIYRPFSGYGEDQHDTYPFPSIMKKVMNNSSNIEIWSDAVRDFVYIDDIVDYVIQTCFHNENMIIKNIGTGIPTSMSQLAKTFSKIIHNTEINVIVQENKPKGVFYRVSIENDDYKWTSLEDGVKKSLEKYS
jgi:GDP-L-fucose synthase